MLEQIKSIEDVGADIIKNEAIEYDSHGIITVNQISPKFSSRTEKDMKFFNQLAVLRPEDLEMLKEQYIHENLIKFSRGPKLSNYKMDQNSNDQNKCKTPTPVIY